ncbi:hypothetical protein BAY61_15540 [Prauserella marina]|uniref:Glycoside-hydrolase family GH114 n=1 Tax=Prauserella marina TaxID=530584 RepID=A0A222VQI9_9PSEU|nr:endo alpha-1,4 polygalactosaminidase [Prauserella marina]ASR36185.1 hypothetical protein BAY61_15540 [Prauserella marina]PWV76936.1 glycosyl hydrolase family 114 [Prauserella marina]SDD00721.1 Glycoside-hydrolase family GH114 [Prauserella marina]
MRRQLRRRVTVSAVLGCVLAACSPAPAPDNDVPGPAFPAGAPFDYQLGGGYRPAPAVRLVVRDSTAEPAPNVYNVCYVNGFQTQPAHRSLWLREHADLVLRDRLGAPVADPEWPGELVLDTSGEDKRQRIATVIGEVIAGCARAGFDAVELDNLDSFTRSAGRLSAADNLALAAGLVRTAHANGLLAGQKNAAELSDRAREEAGFDFAVAEECLAYRECAAYTEVYGDRVIDIEYPDTLAEPFAEACARDDAVAATILRDRPLLAPGEPNHRYEAC